MTHLEVIQKVWPDWKVTEKIGEGSFGQVFKAEKESFGIKQESAIKVVRIPGDEAELEKVKSSFGLDDEELRDYFYPQLDKLKKEIELMMKLDDSNIVKIHDFEIKESLDSKIGWYILIRMELLECLEKYVKNNDMTVADVVSIGEDILSCLETCEENNIIHRDIKPANLFRNDKGVYKLGDFGIAKDVSASVGSLSYKGTENYMAPEVYMGKRYNSTIDIYALGIVLYKLLNRNRLPFMSQEQLTSASIEKAFQKRNTGEPLPKPMQASEAIYKVIKKMCAYRPEDRFQTAAEAKKALTEYKRTDSEELEAVLDISNKTRKLVGTEISYKETEKSIAKLEYINPAKPEIKPAEKEQAMQAEPAIPIVKEESTTKDTVDTKETIQSQLFNEPNNIEQADEDLGNKTRSLFQEKEKPIVQESQSPENRQIIQEEDKGVRKKKSKFPIIAGIGAACIVILAAVFFFVIGNANASKVAIAKEIYADDNMFVIDKDEYKGKYIECTTRLWARGEFAERSGIYVGETKGGEPEGYGAFYYRREDREDDGKRTKDIIFIGTWEKGILISKEGADKVKKRVSGNKKYNTGDKLNYNYIMEGDWGIGDFVGNPKGTYSEEYTTKETGEVTKKRFEGTLEVADEGYNRVNGNWYYNGNLLYRGEYKNDKPYNGTYYDEDGNKTSKVVDGVKQSY